MQWRLHPVPFSVKMRKKERDPDLSDKLLAKYPAILRWVLDGCVEYRRINLPPPDFVRAATDDYLQGEDVFFQWLANCCEVGSKHWELTGFPVQILGSDEEDVVRLIQAGKC